MVHDAAWQFFKLASLVVKAPPLFTFAIGEAVTDSDGHSLIGGPLTPGSELQFQPCSPAVPFEGCDHFSLTVGGNEIEIGIRDGKVQSAFYDYEIYRESGTRRMRKLRYLLREHSATDRLFEYVDNGSSILYNSKEGTQFAVYGYLADTFLIYSTAVKPIRRTAPIATA